MNSRSISSKESILVNNGANITVVAKYLGHSKIDETLNTYSHMYQNRLDTIVNIIELQNSKLDKPSGKPEEGATIVFRSGNWVIEKRTSNHGFAGWNLRRENDR